MKKIKDILRALIISIGALVAPGIFVVFTKIPTISFSWWTVGGAIIGIVMYFFIVFGMDSTYRKSKAIIWLPLCGVIAIMALAFIAPRFRIRVPVEALLFYYTFVVLAIIVCIFMYVKASTKKSRIRRVNVTPDDDDD